MAHRESFVVATSGRCIEPVTREVEAIVARAGIGVGVAHVFLRHTSASLVVTENADPDVRRDLQAWLCRLVKDGDPLFRHRDEGDDDMSAHVKSALLPTSVTIPVVEGRLELGTWQGVYLWEHRTSPHRRTLTVVVTG